MSKGPVFRAKIWLFLGMIAFAVLLFVIEMSASF